MKQNTKSKKKKKKKKKKSKKDAYRRANYCFHLHIGIIYF